MMEGQLDFLGLLNEYRDDQGALVRVREPKEKRIKPRAPFFEKEEVKAEQLSFDFAVEPEPNKVEKPVEKPKEEQVETPKEKPAEKPKEETAEKVKGKAKAKVAKEEPKKTEAVIEKQEVAFAEKKEKSLVEHKEESTADNKEVLFKQCKKCWCFDCKHNSRNQGVLREMCGKMIPCPACDGCISEDMATICEIGNAKEGCRLRAMEEGILIEDEDV